MAVEEFEFTANAEIGNHCDFGSATLIERFMHGELDDGREVEVFRAATGHPYFEIRVEGAELHMRISLMKVFVALAEQLGERTAIEEVTS